VAGRLSGPLPGQGTVHPVVRWGDPVMHRVQRPVTDYDDELRRLVADLVATMYAADGVGLAACQIGVDLSVFVFDCPDETGTRHQGVAAGSTTPRRAASPFPGPSCRAPVRRTPGWTASTPTARR
jgi:hypothetical protein